MIVTTSQKASETIKDKAKALAVQYNLPYEKRRKRSMSALLSEHAPIAVLSGSELTIYFSESQHVSFHLSMAQLRILQLERGENDHLINAITYLSSEKPLSILDCTLGLGSDSVVLSYAFPESNITSLEGSFPIYLCTSYGLAQYTHSNSKITSALRNINPIFGDFRDYLFTLEENSVDIVYFDPMFESPVESSPQFIPLRGHTLDSTISDTILKQAKLVAKKGVIIKERPFSSIFKQFKPDTWIGGKYSRIGYALYVCKE